MESKSLSINALTLAVNRNANGKFRYGCIDNTAHVCRRRLLVDVSFGRCRPFWSRRHLRHSQHARQMSFAKEAIKRGANNEQYMRVSLNPKHLKRYKDIALLLIKHGRSDVVKHCGLQDALDPEASAQTTAGQSKADELAQDLEKMGPAFIKLGQLLSTRADFLPPAYIHALTRLQDKIDPFPFEQVKAIVSAELGVRISKAFSEFETKPLATASLGQVHRAAMHDGRVVVVKVQRPGIREIIAEDMAVLEEIAGFLDKHTQWGRRYEFGKMLEELRKSLWLELDYRQEARNLLITPYK